MASDKYFVINGKEGKLSNIRKGSAKLADSVENAWYLNLTNNEIKESLSFIVKALEPKALPDNTPIEFKESDEKGVIYSGKTTLGFIRAIVASEAFPVCEKREKTRTKKEEGEKKDALSFLD